MVNLPHRFVPTTSKFVSPVRIVTQCGHGAGITAVSFSPSASYFASADEDGWLRIWSLDTLDILGIYLVGFKCSEIQWEGLHAVICSNKSKKHRIEFSDENEDVSSADSLLSGNVIRLLDAPYVTGDDQSITVHYGDNEFVHEIPGLVGYQLEPCERYVVTMTEKMIQVFSAFEDTLMMEIQAPEDRVWMAFAISRRGDFFSAVLNDGSIWYGDAVKQSSKCVSRGNTEVTAVCFGDDRYMLYGDKRGNLTVYDMVERALLLRTPRRPIDFVHMFPAADKTGFVALRPESATAFFSQSHEILSASPLPAPVCAACSGSLFSELIVACTDHFVYRIKLDDNSLTRICKVSKNIDSLACTNDIVFMHFDDGTSAVWDAELVPLAWKSKTKPTSMAVSENGNTIAALTGNHLDIIDRTGKKETRRVVMRDAVQLICGKEKTANQLLVFLADLRVLSIDMRTGESNELNRLEIENGRVISTAPAAKSYAHVLIESEHGQLVVLRVGLNSGKSSTVLRVMTVGTQIFGAANSEDSVYLRNDATCLRIISGLKAFSIEDWSRSEPLQIF